MSTVRVSQGQFPHIKWIDLKGNGIMVECAVMKEDSNGNIYYFELSNLDSIDRQRVARVVQSRNAKTMELWDVMANTTLNNGVNALQYFHQLVKVISSNGVVYSPKSGNVGTGTVDTNRQAATA